MNVAKWLLGAILLLPVAELAVFVAVAAALGFAPALGLLLATSFAGALLLRYAGGVHVARVRVAVSQGSFSALRADNSGSLVLLAGILLLIPGFITDVIGLIVLLGGLSAALRRGPAGSGTGDDSVLDLEPEQWRRVSDPALTGRHEPDRDRRRMQPCSPKHPMLANRGLRTGSSGSPA